MRSQRRCHLCRTHLGTAHSKTSHDNADHKCKAGQYHECIAVPEVGGDWSIKANLVQLEASLNVVQNGDWPQSQRENHCYK